MADAGPDRTVDLGTSVVLDGSGSSDDRGIKSHVWTVVEDNETFFLRGERVDFLFGSPGQYDVTLTVTDHNGKEDSDQLVVTVL